MLVPIGLWNLLWTVLHPEALALPGALTLALASAVQGEGAIASAPQCHTGIAWFKKSIVG